MEPNPYKSTHAKEELSLELNFRSFLAGEGGPFFEPVAVADLVTYATVGAPITIPASAPYSLDDLQRIAQAAKQGGGTLTLLGASNYPAEILDRLEQTAPGKIRHG